jgi:hypothetical protein
LVLGSVLGGCSSFEATPEGDVNGLEGTSLRELDFPRADAPGSTRDSANLFISGHSLVDQPLPNNLALIGSSLGTPIEWNRQYVVGSSILARTRGSGEPPGSWKGYRGGSNREGEGLDVIAELRAPKTIAGPRYDVLLITEQHGLLGTLIWNDTVKFLRHYHDRFIDGNAEGSTYFYHSWLSLRSKDDPRDWIEYERAASPIWACIATRVNVSLALEGRKDRVVSVPAALALAELIATATGPTGLPGVTRASVRETVDLLIKDEVHVTEAGSYFVSLVAYASMFRRDPSGAALPEVLSPELGRALQKFAWGFVERYYSAYRPLPLNECRRRVADFIPHYWQYVHDTYFVKENNALHARLRWARHRLEWGWKLSRDDANNPLWFDPKTDANVWLPAP